MKLTLRVIKQQMRVSHANAVVVVQVDFNRVGGIAESQDGNFRIDKREVLE